MDEIPHRNYIDTYFNCDVSCSITDHIDVRKKNGQYLQMAEPSDSLMATGVESALNKGEYTLLKATARQV